MYKKRIALFALCFWGIFSLPMLFVIFLFPDDHGYALIIFYLVTAGSVWGYAVAVFPRYLGLFVGLVILAGGGYLIINSEAFPFIKLLQSYRVVSILGLWLTSSGIVGKSRLDSWDRKIKTFSFDSTAEVVREKYSKTLEFVFRVLALIIVLSIICITLFFIWNSATKDLAWNLKDLLVGVYDLVNIGGFAIWLIGAILILLYIFTHQFIGYVLLAPVLLLYVPYFVVRSADETNVVERTLVFIGLILGTIGLLFDI
jgi:hypothetical protein